MKRITFLLLTLLALVLAACSDNSGGSSTSASVSASAAATSPAQSDEASEQPTESSSDGTALPSVDLPNSAPELAELLPDEIGGQQVQKISMSGAELMAEGSGTDPELISFLERVGAQPEDISVAFVFKFSAAGDNAGIAAFRVAGASSDELEREFRASPDSEGETIDWQEQSVGGKDVLTAPDTNIEGATQYLYTVGDIVFIVTSTMEETAAELLEPLP